MSDDTPVKPCIPSISVEADLLAKRIAALAPGEVLTYNEMSALVAFDIRDGKRHLLYTARYNAETNYNVVTVTVPRVGIRRATGRDYDTIVTVAVAGIRRKGQRALRSSLRMPENEYKALPQSEQVHLNLGRTLVGTVVHFVGRAAQRAVAARVEAANNRLMFGDVLSLFMPKDK